MLASDPSGPPDLFDIVKTGRPIGRPVLIFSYLALLQHTSIFDKLIISPALRFSVGV